MKAILRTMLFLLGLGIFPGCTRIIDWAKEEVPQIDCCIDECELSCSSIRTIQSYDQFALKAKFDVLYLSDTVFEYYVQRSAYRTGLTENQKAIALKNEREEGKHFISFYILSLYDVPLGKISEWALLLEVNNNLYAPLEIKQVDLPREYFCLFGVKYNRFKTTYKVRFNAQDVQGNDIVNNSTKVIRLLFRNVDCQVSACWGV